MKIIGIELRIQAYGRAGQINREVAIVPCNIEIELVPDGYDSIMMNGTLHTQEFGDIAINPFQIPHPQTTKILNDSRGFRAEQK